jgi:DNA-binding NarL/FixJ family response regulator
VTGLGGENAKLRRNVVTQVAATGRRFGLSARELEVLTQLVLGNSNRQIASALEVSEKTVKNHLSKIYADMDVRNRIEAATVTLLFDISGTELPSAA